jgi:hypothetical protein
MRTTVPLSTRSVAALVAVLLAAVAAVLIVTGRSSGSPAATGATAVPSAGAGAAAAGTAGLTPSAAPSTRAVPPAGARVSATADRTEPARTVHPRSRPALDGDVDGDGRVDAVSFPAPGTLRVRYAAGGTDTVAFEAWPQDAVALLGIVDTDRDGYAEVVVRTAAGVSTEFASLFRYVDGRLAVVTLNGKQASLAYGGSVRHFDYWGCEPGGRIVQWSGMTEDGVVYPGTLTTFRLSGTTLVQTSVRPFTMTEDRQPPRDCGSIHF